MPKIEVPKIIRDLDLGEYAKELSGQSIPVWVNPPRKLLIEFSDITKEVQSESDSGNNKLFGWFATIWSQGDIEETEESVLEFALECQDTDPGLWPFVTGKTMWMIFEHRKIEQKK